MSAPLRIAVVGSGPSGMYAIEHLLHNSSFSVEIDLFERLPVPWGLVRYGVAPDHPEKKLIASRLYNHLISHHNVRFFGNVEVGKDISHSELSEWYDSVIYASGANSDNKMNIPGEELAGSWSAREFVAWYNGHPDYSQLEFDLSSKRALIVGNGNVAIDVARILMLPIEELKKTDIANHAIEALSQSKIKEVIILGRRGYQSGAYNNPELEELVHLKDVQVSVEDPDFDLGDKSGLKMDSSKVDWETQRKIRTLQQLVKNEITDTPKKITFKFLSSPKALLGSGKVEQLSFEHNELIIGDNERHTIKPSGKVSTIETNLVFRAIGYRGQVFAGLPFDSNRNVIENKQGRVCQNGEIIKGAYVTGWIKRGPRGVIGTNKQCSEETVKCMLEDFAFLENDSKIDAKISLPKGAVLEKMQEKGINHVSLDGWNNIDRAEKEQGRAEQRPRSKICDINEMLAAAET